MDFFTDTGDPCRSNPFLPKCIRTWNVALVGAEACAEMQKPCNSGGRHSDRERNFVYNSGVGSLHHLG